MKRSHIHAHSFPRMPSKGMYFIKKSAIPFIRIGIDEIGIITRIKQHPIGVVNAKRAS